MAERRAERDAFFAALPANEFTAWETGLRQVLLDCLKVKPAHFPLVEWIDRRLGGEVQTNRDESGQSEISVNAAAGGPQSSHNPVEAFFAGLPTDSFLAEEDAVRESIFNFLASWKSQELANLMHLGSDRNVQDCRRALMPQEVPLADWIERRIGGEVELRKDGRGQFIIHLTPIARPIVTAKYEAMMASGRAAPPAPRQRTDGPSAKGGGKGGGKEAWFAALPQNELTRDEAGLRQAILDSLQNWPKWRSGSRARSPFPLLSEVLQDAEVQRLSAIFLPPSVPARDWIDRRIGGEIEIRPDGAGQFEILVRGSKAPPQDASPPPARAARPAAETAEAYFATLPEDELTPEEIGLRQAVLDYLEATMDIPQLTELSKDRAVREARTALLPADVALRLWLDRRIGGEVEVIRDDKGLFIVRLRSRIAETPVPAVNKEEASQNFFSSLPDDCFTDGEEKLREATLGFLERWQDKDQPPTLTQTGSDAEIRRLWGTVLPRGSPVPLKEWIDRRMGGEIETLPDGTGQFLIGLRDQCDLAAAVRKRKADGPAGGKGQRPAAAQSGGPGGAWKKPKVDGKGGAARGPGR